MTTIPPPGPTRTPGGFGIELRLGAAVIRAPASSKEDYRPQAILRLYRPSSLDDRIRHSIIVSQLCYFDIYVSTK